MYSTLTYDVMKSYLTRVLDNQIPLMAELHRKQGLLCRCITKYRHKG